MNTYECPRCKKRTWGNLGKYYMANHMKRHDTTRIKNRTCKVEGCENMGHTFKTNQAYGRHEVSVALETNGTFTQLTSVVPSEATVMQPPLLKSLVRVLNMQMPFPLPLSESLLQILCGRIRIRRL
jgi:hypothetical protein